MLYSWMGTNNTIRYCTHFFPLNLSLKEIITDLRKFLCCIFLAISHITQNDLPPLRFHSQGDIANRSLWSVCLRDLFTDSHFIDLDMLFSKSSANWAKRHCLKCRPHILSGRDLSMTFFFYWLLLVSIFFLLKLWALNMEPFMNCQIALWIFCCKSVHK